MPHSETRHTVLVAFDVGNTSVKCATPAAEAWERIFRCPTRPVADLCSRMEEAGASSLPAAGAACVVASVCPEADDAVADFCRMRDWEPRFFRRDLPVPIPTQPAEPEKVGVDRLLLALGARDSCGAPCVVASAGTAVTVDLVDAAGAFAGGAIMPGLGLAARALHGYAALLPLVSPARPGEALGGGTESAIRSGIYWACAGGIGALVEQYRAEPGCADAPLVLTGSDAPLLLPALADLGARHAPDLIFDGMATALARGQETETGP